MDDLVDKYFREINDYLPLLHEPTFEQCIKNGVHNRHGVFGGTLLLVCANGARFSDDSRIFLEGTDNTQSAGWKWFKQVQTHQKLILIRPPRLYDVQLCAVSVYWLVST